MRLANEDVVEEYLLTKFQFFFALNIISWFYKIAKKRMLLRVVKRNEKIILLSCTLLTVFLYAFSK